MKSTVLNPLIWLLISLSGFSCNSLQKPELRMAGSRLKGPSATASPRSQNLRGFHWPVERARLTQEFKPSGRKKHLGIDLAAPRGSALLAAHSGRVIYTGSDFSGFGNMILIESDGGWASLYAHCDKIYVSEGQRVVLGEVLASMGDTGRTTGVHLHFELRKDKIPVDPLVYLPKPLVAQSN